MSFKQVSSTVNFAEIDEQLIKYWKENRTFEKSIEERPEEKKWTFLDGPPFVTGSPHYGSLLSSIPKDVFGRFWTMKGYRVRRVWGWDGHGLPIENKVENKLHIKRKRDIEEKVGVKKFIEECYSYVEDVSDDWEWYVDHIGRWVDFKNAYKTWDMDYMESVMWVFKQMYDKGYIYKGLRVSLYCPHCSTPISNFEVAMDADNYKEVKEPTAVFKYQLKEEKDTFILAWSTTPWNKIVTPALAINPELTYVKVKLGDEKYILAKSTIKMLKEEPKYEVLEEIKGSDLVGLEFIPHYDFYADKIKPGEKQFVVVADEFVTAEEGTGVVTLAVYGEEDLKVMQRDNIQMVFHVDEEGIINEDVPKFGGLYYLDSNEKVLEDLESRKLIYRLDEYAHNVAHCWRCGTRLFFAPKDAWYVNIQEIKPQLFKNNEPINWFPKHFKHGRFSKSMEAAPDWNISRNRYWGSPVPVWECGCGERFVPGSVKELEEQSGTKVTNLHKPEIDEVEIKCKKCSKQVKRVPEVLDSWIEAGSASFGERHFPFDNSEKLEDFFPPDFVAEYTGQIRAWFYVLHVLGTALYDSPAFKNVLVEGVMLGTDGRKMSKNYGNYPDPKEVMEKYGGDALRLYLLGSPIMKGEDVNFSNDGVPEVTRGFLLILWNSYKYFIDYASIFNWSCTAPGGDAPKDKLNVLDKWILAKLTKLVLDLNKYYENFDTFSTVKALREFVVSDFSTWYIRRSRERISNNQNEADRNVSLSVMYGVLVALCKLMAPIAPFIAEEMYTNLTSDESVHLTEYPKGDRSLLDDQLIAHMGIVRQIVEQGHARRKESEIKLRQPLSKITYSAKEKLDPDLENIIKEELNVKAVEYQKSSNDLPSVKLDTNITPELKEEGEARDFIRQIQQLRKDSGMTLQDKIEIKAPAWSKKFEELILRSTASVKISESDELKIEKI
jgi:isoleucyl-tRNA synthetase